MTKCACRVISFGLGVVFCVALPSPALAQGYLGANLRPFAVLAGTTVTCAGASNITGDVGVSPGSAIVGFPAPCTDVGTLRVPPASDPAQLDLTAAYTTLTGLPCAATVGPNLAGLTLTQGVYCVGAAASNLTGTLTLDAQGNPSAVFVFRMSSTLITSRLHGELDQWRQCVRRRVAGQQLRNDRCWHDVRRKHPRADEPLDEFRCKPDR